MKPVFKKKLPPMPATLTSLRAYTQIHRLFEDTPNARALRLHAAHNWDAWYESACLPDSIGFSSYVQSLVTWNNDRGNPLSLDIAAAATSLTVRGWFNVEAQLVEYDLKAKLHDWSATSVAYGVVTYRQDTLDSMELPPELTQYGGTSLTEKVMANLHEVYYQKAMPSLVMMITLTFMIGYIAMWTGLATWGPASSAVQAEWLSTVEWSLLGVFLLLLGGLFNLDFNAIGASSHAKQFVESVPDTWPQVFEGKTAQSTWLMASMWDRMYWYSQSDPRTLQNIKGWTPQTAAIFSLAQATTAMSTARGELFIAHNETATACHDSHDILDERLVAEHVITH